MRICVVYQGADLRPTERIDKLTKTLISGGHEVFLLINDYGESLDSHERTADGHTYRLKPTFPNVFLNKIVKFPVFLNPLWIIQMYRFARKHNAQAIQVVDLPLAAAA